MAHTPNKKPIALHAGAEECVQARFSALSSFGVNGAEAPKVFQVFPGGTHEIVAAMNKVRTKVNVIVDQETAETMQAALEAHSAASPNKPYFDFDHQETKASGWPKRFFWQDAPEPGVYTEVEWSRSGAEAVLGKDYRSFSPAFFVDKTLVSAGKPARVNGAPLIMGGLVNDPAFQSLSPLWARNQTDSTENINMKLTVEQLAALRGEVQNLQSEIATLKSKNSAGTATETDAVVQARAADLRVKEAELATKQANVQAAEASGKVISLEAEIKARNEKAADDAIARAVERGAIPAQDTVIQARYKGLIAADPGNVVLVESLPANAALVVGQVTAGRGAVTEGQSDVNLVVRAYNAEKNVLERGVIYAKALRKLMTTPEGCDAVVRAANSLGTLAGTLVVQRSLDLLKLAFPQLDRISTDFSSENAALNQTIATRLRTVPAVGTYDVTLGYVSADAAATDVNVTINAHKFAQVEFNANELASTRRLLFGENEEGMHYALAKDLIDALYALFTAANYTETATSEALVDVSRKTVTQIGVDMQTSSANRNANFGTRTLLLASDYYGQLSNDLVVVGNLYNSNNAGAIGSGVLPMVSGFLPVEAPNLPNTGNMKGFGLRADAAALAVRPANDYTTALAGLPSTGILQQVTCPDTGLTVTMVQFVDHRLGKSYMRIAWMRGVAVGNPKAGQILKSA